MVPLSALSHLSFPALWKLARAEGNGNGGNSFFGKRAMVEFPIFQKCNKIGSHFYLIPLDLYWWSFITKTHSCGNGKESTVTGVVLQLSFD